jgi:hypothetical protein
MSEQKDTTQKPEPKTYACIWGRCNGTRPSKDGACDRCGSKRP